MTTVTHDLQRCGAQLLLLELHMQQGRGRNSNTLPARPRAFATSCPRAGIVIGACFWGRTRRGQESIKEVTLRTFPQRAGFAKMEFESPVPEQAGDMLLAEGRGKQQPSDQPQQRPPPARQQQQRQQQPRQQQRRQ